MGYYAYMVMGRGFAIFVTNSEIIKNKGTIMILLLLTSFNLLAACTEMPRINPFELKISNVSFQKKGDQKKWCFKLEGDKQGLIEWSSVNKSNASCGVLKMVVHLPDGTKLKSESVQPGAVTFYKPGKYVMNYTMKTNEPKCRTWDLMVRHP